MCRSRLLSSLFLIVIAFVSADAAMYVVKEGDTLGSIARDQLGAFSRWKEIQDLNPDKLPNPDRLRPGMTLKLPDAASAPPQAARTPAQSGQSVPQPTGIHIVQSGETLMSIARSRLGNASRWQEILDANKHKITLPEDIRPGMTLRLPIAEPVISATQAVKPAEVALPAASSAPPVAPAMVNTPSTASAAATVTSPSVPASSTTDASSTLVSSEPTVSATAPVSTSTQTAEPAIAASTAFEPLRAPELTAAANQPPPSNVPEAAAVSSSVAAPTSSAAVPQVIDLSAQSPAAEPAVERPAPAHAVQQSPAAEPAVERPAPAAIPYQSEIVPTQRRRGNGTAEDEVARAREELDAARRAAGVSSSTASMPAASAPPAAASVPAVSSPQAPVSASTSTSTQSARASQSSTAPTTSTSTAATSSSSTASTRSTSASPSPSVSTAAAAQPAAAPQPSRTSVRQEPPYAAQPASAPARVSSYYVEPFEKRSGSRSDAEIGASIGKNLAASWQSSGALASAPGKADFAVLGEYWVSDDKVTVMAKVMKGMRVVSELQWHFRRDEFAAGSNIYELMRREIEQAALR